MSLLLFIYLKKIYKKDGSYFIIALLVQAVPSGGDPTISSICDFVAQMNVLGNSTGYPPNGGIAAGAMLPTILDYFYYQGSLPYPPCTESVDWAVLINPIQVNTDMNWKDKI